YSSPEGQDILKGISFEINAPDRILLQGASGSGKTTLLKIISGVLEYTGGAFYINDRSYKGVWPNKYRSKLGQVLPDQSPFEGTILENITFGREDISNEEVHHVLRQLELLDFVREQPKGLKTKLYPEGQYIPYSVAIRIVLARAIVHKPKFLVLKDPLELVDSAIAERIIEFLAAPERPWALIVVSRNPLWQKACNRIIQLDEGKILTKSGNHA
ncbi:MAG: ABC transporter ATP-binding protein, partial [Flavobacteriaceae bacterium]|nr:ABC transporter ATP-binding protein [Flavobacteriaceae bacterium]